jgi:pimeloyl-ACP methyl ester carboxylesterase
LNKYTVSSDGQRIHYLITGKAMAAIVFVHGWLGSAAWWNKQQKYFTDRYTVVQMDLPGHGGSDRSRQIWSSDLYAADIKAVVDQIGSQKVVLLGHSMSGAYVLEASLSIPAVKAVILVDTLKNLDQLLSYAQAEEHLFAHYRHDFKSAVEDLLPQFLFAKTTPVPIQKQLQGEFLKYDPELAVRVIEPLYKMDIRGIAKRIQIPVRAINSDYSPTNRDNNRKYFRNFDYTTIHGTGHYPMLERPDEFNKALDEKLRELAF